MRRFGLCALEVFAVVAMAGGCGGSAPLGSSSVGESLNHIAAISTDDLLYVVNARPNAVLYLTLSSGKLVGQLSNIGHPRSVCSDTRGNVWVTSDFRRRAYKLYEFAHGGTQPIAIIDVPRPNVANGCAVDPMTGNIAAVNTDYDSVLIWASGYPGKPAKFFVPFFPWACAYDDRGNLLVAGYGDGFPAYALLYRGAPKTVSVIIRTHGFSVGGGVQWDGRYFAIGGDRGIVRVQIAGSKAKVIQRVRALDLALQPWIWVRGDTLVAAHEPHQGSRIAVYKYPAGGAPVRIYSGFITPLGLTVSGGKGE